MSNSNSFSRISVLLEKSYINFLQFFTRLCIPREILYRLPKAFHAALYSWGNPLSSSYSASRVSLFLGKSCSVFLELFRASVYSYGNPVSTSWGFSSVSLFLGKSCIDFKELFKCLYIPREMLYRFPSAFHASLYSQGNPVSTS